MKRILVPASLLALAVACGRDSNPTSPSVVKPAGPTFDDIANNLDASIDAMAEVMPLTLGAADGTTTLYVQPRNGDGKNGCNLAGDVTLVVTVASSDAAVATVSPASVTFTSCTDDRPTLTVTPVSQGSATITLSLVSNSTSGTFDLTGAKFTVNVSPPPNTAPTVAVAGVIGGASYPKGSVPAATCQVTDAEDGDSSFAATLSTITGPDAGGGIGSQTASCSYTDGGGLKAASSVTYSIVDASPPTIGYALDPTAPDGSNGWYTSDVTLTWTVIESDSPSTLEETGCVDQSITADQVETTYTCSATSDGGSAAEVAVKIKRDATAPTVDLLGGPINGAIYYYGSVPAAPTCSASDPGSFSGLDGGCTVVGYSDAVGTHTVKATAMDKAGNAGSSVSATYTVKAWNASGFYQPTDMGSVVNTVKGGSTVPLKFEIFAGSELSDVRAVKTFTFARIDCSTTGTLTDDIELVTTGGTSLRYDETAGQFIQNWQTPKTAGLCYKVTLTAQDGSTISALFKLK